jgi:CRP/FNR family transcriptional regulator, anaerobic regulatory protein
MLDLENIFEKDLVLSKGEIFIKKGEINTNIYFVKEGSVKIFIENDKEDQIVRFGYKNDLIVALDSFLNNQATEFYFEAIKQTHLISIEKNKFMAFIQSDPENQKKWTTILEGLVLQQMEREIDLLIHSPKERYLRVLKRSPKLFQEIPNKYIANYLRMTPETFSRIKKS